jgi:hypothetical protein
VEQARHRVRLDGGATVLGVPLGARATHVVALGVVGVEQRLDEAQNLGKLGSQHRGCLGANLGFARPHHNALLSAFPPRGRSYRPHPLGRLTKRQGSGVTIGRNSLKTGTNLANGLLLLRSSFPAGYSACDTLAVMRGGR